MYIVLLHSKIIWPPLNLQQKSLNFSILIDFFYSYKQQEFKQRRLLNLSRIDIYSFFHL